MPDSHVTSTDMASVPPSADSVGARSSTAASRSCPFCREAVHADAIKCRHCQSFLVPMAENCSGDRSATPSINVVTTTTQPIMASSFGQEPRIRTVAPLATAPNTSLGHAWGVFSLALVLFLVTGVMLGENGEGSVSGGYAVFCALAIGPWAIWLLNQENANRVLPVLALVGLVLIGLNSVS